MEAKKLSDEELDAVVGGMGGTSNSKKNVPICECGQSLTFYHNVDETSAKFYCSKCKKVYLYNLTTNTLTATGETVSF